MEGTVYDFRRFQAVVLKIESILLLIINYLQRCDEKNRCICWKKRATLPNFALPKKGFFVGGIAPASHKTNYHE
jgi:hypothetical protein